jgi:arylsulfatase
MTYINRRFMNEKNVLNALTSALILAAGASLPLHAQTAQPYQGVVGRTLAESKEWWPEPVKAPAGAPNVVWILIDDVGFGAAVYELPYDRDLCPHPLSSADWP